MKLRTLAKIVGALLALLIVSALAVPLFISNDLLKTQLIAQVKKATGRDLTIVGKTTLTLFPNIAVSASDVTLGNPTGFTDPYFAHIGTLKTSAALGPLLHGALDVTGIAIDGATLNLEQNAAGAKNWEFTQQKAQQAAAQSAAKNANSHPTRPFALGDVTIGKTTIRYRKPGAPVVQLDDVTLTLSGADGASPLKLDGRFNYRKETVKLQVTLDRLKDFLAGTATKFSAQIALPEATAKFTGTGGMKETFAASGATEIAIDDLPKLLAWATGKPAAANLPKKLHAKTQLTATGAPSVTLGDLVLDADGVAAKGMLKANLAAAVPAVEGYLHLGTLDLARFANPKAAHSTTASPTSTAAEQGWSGDPIDFSALSTLNASLELDIDALRSGSLNVDNIAAKITLRDGTLRAVLNDAQLYGGNAGAFVTLARNAVKLEKIQLTRIQIEPLATALAGQSRVQGTANLFADLSATGGSVRALIASLSGPLKLNVANGAIKGINIAQFLREAKKGFLVANDTGKSTDFTELSASGNFAQGVFTNNDLSMKSPALRLAGSGTVSLPSRTLDYRLVPTLAVTSKGQGGQATADVAGLSVPLRVTGPWSQPQIVPDIGGMIQENLKNPAALQQNLKNFNSPKDIRNALFGNKPSSTPADGTTPAPQQKPKLGDLLKGL